MKLQPAAVSLASHKDWKQVETASHDFVSKVAELLFCYFGFQTQHKVMVQTHSVILRHSQAGFFSMFPVLMLC